MNNVIAENAIKIAEQNPNMLSNFLAENKPEYGLISLAPVPDDLPSRPWLIDRALMDGQVTMLTGRGGEGKSLLALQLAITVAMGKDFAWWKVKERRKVLLLNAEDNIDELQRRLLSASEVMGIEPEALTDNVFTLDSDNIILIHRDVEDQKIKPTQLYNKIIDHIRMHRIGLLVVDPLIETHAYLDENSNVDMKALIMMLRRLARSCGIPVLIVHHSRKGATVGDQDGARGGSSLVNACRIVLTLDRMDQTTFDKYHPPLEKEFYVRVAGAKANYAGRQAESWLQLESVLLNNGDSSPGFKQVVFDELSPAFNPFDWEHRDAFLTIVRNGRGDGKYWSPAQTGKKEARLDAKVAESFKLSAHMAKEVIRHFGEAKIIKTELQLDGHRKPIKIWEVNDDIRLDPFK